MRLLINSMKIVEDTFRHFTVIIELATPSCLVLYSKHAAKRKKGQST